MKKIIPIIVLLMMLFASPAWAGVCLPSIFSDRPFVAPPYSLYGGGNCTWFAWEMAYQYYGVKLPYAGNAKEWVSLNGQDVSVGDAVYRISLSDKLEPYSIAVWQDGFYGHVAWVENRLEFGLPTMLQSLMYPPVTISQAPNMYWHDCFWKEAGSFPPAQYLIFSLAS